MNDRVEDSMSTSELVPVAELAQKSVSWSVLAERAVISTQDELDTAAQHLRGIKALRDEIAKTFDPIIEAAHKAHRKAIEQRKLIEAPLLDAKTILDRKVGTYAAKVERDARLERERIEAAARAERERQEGLARAERLKAEEAARAERERAEREARELRIAGDRDAALRVEEEAAKLAAKHDEDAKAATELKQEAAMMPPPYVPPPLPTRAVGVSTRDTYKFEVTNLLELVQAVAAGKAPLRYLDANLAIIGGEVRASKGQLDVAGVRVYVEKSVVTR